MTKSRLLSNFKYPYYSPDEPLLNCIENLQKKQTNEDSPSQLIPEEIEALYQPIKRFLERNTTADKIDKINEDFKKFKADLKQALIALAIDQTYINGLLYALQQFHPKHLPYHRAVRELEITLQDQDRYDPALKTAASEILHKVCAYRMFHYEASDEPGFTEILKAINTGIKDPTNTNNYKALTELESSLPYHGTSRFGLGLALMGSITLFVSLVGIAISIAGMVLTGGAAALLVAPLLIACTFTLIVSAKLLSMGIHEIKEQKLKSQALQSHYGLFKTKCQPKEDQREPGIDGSIELYSQTSLLTH